MAQRLKKPATGTKVRKAPAAKAAAPKAARPSVPMHSFQSGWTGASDGVNTRVSRTKIDSTRFGSLADAPLTERDQQNLAALRSQFGGKQFVRANIDAGILRRLGERGYVEHVSGGMNEATATFRLTNKKAA